MGAVPVQASKTVSGLFNPNTNVTYTIVVTNFGTTTQQDNPGNEFTDVLPPTLALVSASATSGTAVATLGTNTVTWNGSIPGTGGTVTITITATIVNGTPGGTVVLNQGTVSFDADNNGTNEGSILTDFPGAQGAQDPTPFTVVDAVPAMPVVATLVLAFAGLLLGSFAVRRRRAGLS